MSARTRARENAIDQIIRLLPQWPAFDPELVRQHLESLRTPELSRMARALDSLIERRSADDPDRQRWEAVEKKVRSLASIRPLIDQWNGLNETSGAHLRASMETVPPSAVSSGHRVYRVGKAPDAWFRVSPGSYRTIYASSSILGAYRETLLPLRPALSALEGIRRVVDDAELRATPSAGTIGGDWLRRRHLGTALLRGKFFDLDDERSRAIFRDELASVPESLGIDEFDRAVSAGIPRKVSMAISRFVFDHMSYDGQRFDGIRYRAPSGDSVWAIFERDGEWCIEQAQSVPIEPNDPALVRAMQTLGITASQIAV